MKRIFEGYKCTLGKITCKLMNNQQRNTLLCTNQAISDFKMKTTSQILQNDSEPYTPFPLAASLQMKQQILMMFGIVETNPERKQEVSSLRDQVGSSKYVIVGLSDRYDFYHDRNVKILNLIISYTRIESKSYNKTACKTTSWIYQQPVFALLWLYLISVRPSYEQSYHFFFFSYINIDASY